MLVAYFDESGGQDDGFTAVCGWASSVEQWSRFEIDWKLMLARYHVPFFHMKLFSQFKKPFERFRGNQGETKNFLKDAVDIIRSNVRLGFLFQIDHRTFAEARHIYQIDEVFSSEYAMGGRLCVTAANRWRRKETQEKELKVFFEDGGPDKGGLLRAMRTIIPYFDDPGFEPSVDYKPSKKWPEGRKGLVQLQAADFLAYEAGKAKRDRLTGRTKEFRKSLDALLGVRMEMSVPLLENFERYFQQSGIKRRE